MDAMLSACENVEKRPTIAAPVTSVDLHYNFKEPNRPPKIQVNREHQHPYPALTRNTNCTVFDRRRRQVRDIGLGSKEIILIPDHAYREILYGSCGRVHPVFKNIVLLVILENFIHCEKKAAW